jgi:hypothetical protein
MVKKPPLKECYKRARLDFAKRCVRNGGDWSNIIWSDEKKFNLNCPDGFRHYWHELCKELLKFSKRHSGGDSTTVWAAFNCNGKTQIKFMSGRATSKDYIDILSTHLIPFIEPNSTFQQDNAPITSQKLHLNGSRITTFDCLSGRRAVLSSIRSKIYGVYSSLEFTPMESNIRMLTN